VNTYTRRVRTYMYIKRAIPRKLDCTSQFHWTRELGQTFIWCKESKQHPVRSQPARTKTHLVLAPLQWQPKCH